MVFATTPKSPAIHADRIDSFICSIEGPGVPIVCPRFKVRMLTRLSYLPHLVKQNLPVLQSIAASLSRYPPVPTHLAVIRLRAWTSPADTRCLYSPSPALSCFREPSLPRRRPI